MPRLGIEVDRDSNTRKKRKEKNRERPGGEDPGLTSMNNFSSFQNEDENLFARSESGSTDDISTSDDGGNLAEKVRLLSSKYAELERKINMNDLFPRDDDIENDPRFQKEDLDTSRDSFTNNVTAAYRKDPDYDESEVQLNDDSNAFMISAKVGSVPFITSIFIR